ncbi:hypothetical protein ACJX0J_023739, partial [Zea mays]
MGVGALQLCLIILALANVGHLTLEHTHAQEVYTCFKNMFTYTMENCLHVIGRWDSKGAWNKKEDLFMSFRSDNTKYTKTSGQTLGHVMGGQKGYYSKAYEIHLWHKEKGTYKFEIHSCDEWLEVIDIRCYRLRHEVLFLRDKGGDEEVQQMGILTVDSLRVVLSIFHLQKQASVAIHLLIFFVPFVICALVYWEFLLKIFMGVGVEIDD